MVMIRGHAGRSRSTVRPLLLSAVLPVQVLMQRTCKTVTPLTRPTYLLLHCHCPVRSIYTSRSVAGRVAVWTCTGCPTRRGTTKPPNKPPNSCRPFCIGGLEPSIVSTSSNAFHVLWFSSTSVSPVSLLSCPVFHVYHMEAPCTHMEAHTSCCCVREHAVDG